ncbi:MAG: hypothetical protein J6S57_02675 [Alphaproteobacteria bacterium]|nr:hypothetical protein [Alphaproteobacteria bacterium]
MTIFQKIRLLFTLHTKTRHKLRERFVQNDYKRAQSALYSKLKLPKFDVKVRPHSVLLVEPNPYHGEIQPGFVKYFQDLGYNVDIFMRLENHLENPFSDYGKNPPRTFFGTAPIIRNWMNNLKGDEYDYIFLSSSAFWNRPKEFFGKYLDYLGKIPESRHGILMIEHNAIPYLTQYDEVKYLKQNRVFALTANNGIPRLNPHYFGEFDVKTFDKSFVKFVVVGGINASCKNHTLLIDCIAEMVADGITNFKVDVVGNGKLEIPIKLKPYINILGRLNYHDMYATVNGADFILALLDPQNPDHNRYKTGTTTGSFQLSLGFNKPMIIEKSFADYYELDSSNAITYLGDDLCNAMRAAMDISKKDYDAKTKNLGKVEKKIYEESLNNLKTAVGK